jgi:hypothetical protein
VAKNSQNAMEKMKSNKEKMWEKKKILLGFNYISCNFSQYSILLGGPSPRKTSAIQILLHHFAQISW